LNDRKDARAARPEENPGCGRGFSFSGAATAVTRGVRILRRSRLRSRLRPRGCASIKADCDVPR